MCDLAGTDFANNEEFVTSIYCAIPTFKWAIFENTETIYLSRVSLDAVN